MTRIRYSPEEKEKALRLCEAIGVNNASKETGISVNSLYKWRSNTGKEIETPVYNAPETSISNMVSETQTAARVPETESSLSLHQRAAVNEGVHEELVRLRIENDTLKAQMVALKNALRVFTE